MSATDPGASMASVTRLPTRPSFTVVPDIPDAEVWQAVRHDTRPTAADRAARAVVLGLLERLVDGGRVVVEEGGARSAFGELTADRQGRAPLQATIVVHHPTAWRKVLTGGSAGLGEAYFDGWWDTDDLPALLRLLSRAVRRTDPVRSRVDRFTRPVADPVRRLRRPDKRRDKRNIRAHYDLGNDFFELFLDPTMMYSSAVFPTEHASLEEASTHKLDLLCRRLALGPADRVVEIGTGWGGFAVHAAATYGCRVTTTTISDRQFEYATERVRRAGLADRVTVRRDDYRDLTGTYDKLASIEMIEAVDWRDYDTFFATCRRLLTPAGLVGLQAIVIEPQRFDRAKTTQDFIKEFIFPGGCLPSVDALVRSATRSTDLNLTGLDDYGLHYGETLRRWRSALLANHDRLAPLGLGEAFARMWEFYFAYCEAAFDDRAISMVQLTMARPGWRARD